MKHLILCREYPPAPYPPGGIGTYVAHIARVLAERGETVHVIGQRWEGADKDVEISCEGRLIVHRISAEDVALYPTLGISSQTARAEVEGMLASGFPSQWFSWVAAGLSERLIEREGIDIIEGQEWEAPLFYLLQRRALGLGPERKPPCVVHFHSPTEMIFYHNEWSIARPDYLPMKRYEDFVIKSADAYLCPSNYLAGQCTALYGLDSADIYVQPLPRGSTERIARDAETWSKGSICYFGRLEPRKGVVEWLDAAVAVAEKRPTPTFEFIGSNLLYAEDITVKQFVKRRIPDALRDRFVFHDARPRNELLKMLGGACIAAVPSRWENFPNTCIEAMGTGLPVLASRDGGMVEMVEDGKTGWLPVPSKAPLADQLAEALHRALDTSPKQLAAMGEAAAKSIRRICDNDAIAKRHIDVRTEIVARGATRSRTLTGSLPWLEQTTRPVDTRKAKGTPVEGIAVAVLALRGASPSETLASLAAQTIPPAAIVVVSDSDKGTKSHRFVEYPGTSGAVAKQRAMDSLKGMKAAGWLFLEAGDTLDRESLRIYGETLQRCPTVGAVRGWFRDKRTNRLGAAYAAPPSFPYQWLWNELDGPALYRSEALAEAGIRTEVEDGQDGWDIATAVMAAGWAAVRLPALLGSSAGSGRDFGEVALPHSRARRMLIQRFPDLIGRDAPALVGILEAITVQANAQANSNAHHHEPMPTREAIVSAVSVLRRPFRQQVAIAAIALKQPIRTTHWLLWRGKNIIKRRIFMARDAILGSRI
jgi:glycosyltransferase involved in cell wall biosynthesis